jgi:hypothetical protein
VEPFLTDVVKTSIPGVAIAVVTLAASEVGFRVGRWLKVRSDEVGRSEVFAIQGASLSLLALLLGFSFSMGATSHQWRIRVALDEAQAISNAHRRAQLLPEPAGSQMRGLLARYVDSRVGLFHWRADEQGMHRNLRESARLKDQMWTLAVAAGKQAPQSVLVGLVLESLTDLNQLEAQRTIAQNQHVPGAVVLALVLTAVAAMGWVGCSIGFGARRNTGVMVLLSMLFGVIIAIIIDLDQPRHGVVRVSQQALIELQRQLVP